MHMKKYLITLALISVFGLPTIAQDILYSNLKDLLAQRGDTVVSLRIEKRSKNQIALTGGADFRITVGGDESMSKLLKKRCYAVSDTKGNLYVNCRKLRYKRLRFGAWYAPAIRLGQNIYFSAIPLGSAVGATCADTDDVKLGGVVGDALAASSLIAHRVYYEINGESGRVSFVDKDKMRSLLEKHPDWYAEFLKTNCIEARSVDKFLQRLKTEEKRK